MNWHDRIIAADEAAALVKSGNRIFLTGNCSTPRVFLEALVARHETLEHVEVVQLLDFNPKTFITEDLAEHIRLNYLFIGPSARKPIADGNADFTPVFLSEIPALFRSGRLVLDVAVIQVSPPDQHGYCSFGVEVGISKKCGRNCRHRHC
jgi:4-hydroxybutyrate CoA-transferase